MPVRQVRPCSLPGETPKVWVIRWFTVGQAASVPPWALTQAEVLADSISVAVIRLAR